jgi:hypothetical protein
LVREEVNGAKTIYVCSCGLSYDDILLAYACEDYFKTHGVNSEKIIMRAIHNPPKGKPLRP